MHPFPVSWPCLRSLRSYRGTYWKSCWAVGLLCFNFGDHCFPFFISCIMSPLLMAWQGKRGCQKLSDSSGGIVRKHLHESNASRRNFAETINIVQQLFPYLKPILAGPWQLVTTWKSLHPSQLHPPLYRFLCCRPW